MAYLWPDGHEGWFQSRILDHIPGKQLVTIWSEGVAAGTQRWIRGEDGWRTWGGDDDGWTDGHILQNPYPFGPKSDAIPDITDSATAGLLWQMLGRSRERVAHRGLGPDAGWFYHITGEIGSTGRLTLDGWAPSRCLGEACVRVAISTGRWPVVPWPGDRWWLP
jgi:hypothetical protein